MMCTHVHVGIYGVTRLIIFLQGHLPSKQVDLNRNESNYIDRAYVALQKAAKKWAYSQKSLLFDRGYSCTDRK